MKSASERPRLAAEWPGRLHIAEAPEFARRVAGTTRSSRPRSSKTLLDRLKSPRLGRPPTNRGTLRRNLPVPWIEPEDVAQAVLFWLPTCGTIRDRLTIHDRRAADPLKCGSVKAGLTGEFGVGEGPIAREATNEPLARERDSEAAEIRI